MKPLEQQTIGQRIVITMIIVLVILFLLSLVGWMTGGLKGGGPSEPHLVFILPPTKWDDRITELDKQALDDAYKKKIEQLFSVWVSDSTEQPERAAKGALQAKRAYIEAQKALEMREQYRREQAK